MHSRVIQLENKPDFEECTADDLCEEDFVPDKADYVRILDGSEKQEALEWFIGYYGGMAVGEEDGKQVLRIRSKFEVMEGQYNLFKTLLEECTLEKFCERMWRVQAASYLDQHGGFQIFNRGWTMPADEFFCRLEGTGITLYIGSVFDYHY